MLRHSSGEFNAPSHHQYQQTGREFEVGDMVQREDWLPPWRVIDIHDRKARGFVEAFGGIVRVESALEKLSVVR